ncbi:MAG: hypothetical protein E7214_12615 [Clostridium sp.]|nr:hypothetical protein [Clostridium sp.]
MKKFNRNIKKLQKIIGIFISVIMFIQLIMPINFAKAEDLDFITNVSITDLDGAPLDKNVEVNKGIKIYFDYKFDSTKHKPGVKYKVKFPVEIKSEETNYEIIVKDKKIDKEIKLGNFFLDKNGDGYIEFEDFKDDIKASGNFIITTGFNGDAIGDGGKKVITFTVGTKNTDITIDFATSGDDDKPDMPTITKEATDYDRMKNELTWTIKVDAKTTPKNGLYIVDTLRTTKEVNKQKIKIQEFYKDSLYVNGEKAKDDTFTIEDGKFKYKLPDGVTGITTITVKSKLLPEYFKQDDPNKVINKDKIRTANNGVELFQGNKKIKDASASKDIPILWVDKIGAYNIHDRTIDWTITLDNYGETIKNFSLSDVVVSQGRTVTKTGPVTSDETTFISDSLKIVGEDDEELPEEIKKGLKYDPATKTLTFQGSYDRVIKIKYSCKIPDDVYTKEVSMNYKNVAYYEADNLKKDNSTANVPIDGRMIYKDNGNYYQSDTYNPITHELTWRVIVNLNALELKNAVVTDIIPSDQEYVLGSLKPTVSIPGVGIQDYKEFWKENYDEDTKTLTCELGDLKDKVYLEYKTKIKDKNVYGNNFENLSEEQKTFKNTASLSTDLFSIEPSYTAVQTVKDFNVLKKTGVDYDYNSNYVTWKVEVNAEGFRKSGTSKVLYSDITHGKLTDDIPSNQEYVEGSFTIDNGEDLSTFKYIEADKDDKTKSGTLIYDFGSNKINKKYTITYKTKIIDKDFFNPEKNGGKYSNVVKNKVKLEGDELAEGGIVTEGTQEIKCSAIQKGFNYEKSKNKITWKILLNNNKLDLLDGEVLDVIPDGLDVNMSSLKLYKVTIKKDPVTGKFEPDEDTKEEVPILDEYVSFNEKSRELKVGIKNMKNYTYLLEFVTMINTSVLDKNIKSITNSASFNGTVLSGGNSTTVDDVKYVKVEGEGSIEANDITVKKLDADTKKPIEGAKFILLDSDNKQVSDVVTTNKKGEATFNSIEINKNYKVKEVEPAPGYYLDKSKENSKFVMLTVEDLETGKTIEWKNTKIKGSINLTKVNAENVIEKLSGAEFAVYKDVNKDGKYDKDKDIFIGNLNEDKDNIGEYYLNDVESGSYLVKETKAPVGYNLDTQYYKAEIKNNGEKVNIETISGKYFGNTPIKGIFEIKKVDFDNPSKTLPNAIFEIYKDVDDNGKYNEDKDKLVISLNSSTGIYTSTLLPYGSYLVKEVKAPLGYNLDLKYYPYKIEVDSKKVTIENLIGSGVFSNKKIIGSVKINKVDKDDINKKLQGAVFDLYEDVDKDGKYDKNIDKYISKVPGSKGTFSKANLEYGYYLIKESKAPIGYNIDKNYYGFKIDKQGEDVEVSNNKSKLFVNEKIKGSVKVNKTDYEDSSLNLKGAEFTVYKDTDKDGVYNSEKDTIVGTLTDNEGIYTMDNLEYGSYLLKETAAPIGYDKDEKYYPFDILNNNDEKIIENEKGVGFTNKKVDTSVGLTKVDKDDNSIKLTGLTFALYEDTDKDEKLDLNIDKFICNLDEDNGVYYKNHLINGKYLVKEMTSKEGYNIDEKSYPFEISDDNKHVKISNNDDTGLFENEIIKGKVEVNKVDSEDDSKTLTGAEFKIYKDVNKNGKYDEGIDKYYKDLKALDDKYYLSDIPYGSYLINESKAPDGYNIDKNYYGFVIDNKDKNVVISNNNSNVFVNSKIKGSVKLTKIDDENSDLKLKGATFEVYKDINKNGEYDDNDTLVGTLKDNEGIYTMDNLDYGSYLVKEIVAPIGYDKDDEYYSFDILNNNDEKIIENKKGVGFINKKVDTSVELTKVDKDDNSIKLTGLTFALYEDVDKDGKLDLEKDKFLLNLEENDGVYFKKHLLNGHYLIKEEKTLEGYILDDEAYPFEISDENKHAVISNNKDTELFENEIVKGRVEINKVDSEDNSKTLSGAEFKVYKDVNKNGQYDEEIDKYYKDLEALDGKYYLDDIPYGSYLINESKAPEGYDLDKNYYKFVIDNKGKTVVISNNGSGAFINNKIKGSLEITKIDDENSDLKLKGATFEVYKDTNKIGEYDEDDVLVGTLKDNDGVYSMDNLEYGSYLVKETVAPLGYDKDENYYSFEIRNNNDKKIIENEEGKGFINKKVDTSVELTKVDKDFTSVKLKNAVYALYEDVDKDGKLDLEKDKFLLNLEEDEGVYFKKHLLNGYYLIKEVEPPKGYLVDEDVYPFEISDDNKHVVISNNADTKLFEEQIIKGNVKISKVDSEDTTIKLLDAEFKLYKDINGNGKYDEDIDEYLRDFNQIGENYFVEDIPYGSYLVNESKAPKGYERDTKYYSFNISENNKTVEIENEKDKGFTNKKEIANVPASMENSALPNRESGPIDDIQYDDCSQNEVINKADEKIIGSSSNTSDNTNKILYTIAIITSLFVVGMSILSYSKNKKENNN